MFYKRDDLDRAYGLGKAGESTAFMGDQEVKFNPQRFELGAGFIESLSWEREKMEVLELTETVGALLGLISEIKDLDVQFWVHGHTQTVKQEQVDQLHSALRKVYGPENVAYNPMDGNLRGLSIKAGDGKVDISFALTE